MITRLVIGSHSNISLNFTRRRISIPFLLTILKGKNKYGKLLAGMSGRA